MYELFFIELLLMEEKLKAGSNSKQKVGYFSV